jgi:MOSC domain-containing protein YiiM
MTAMTIQTVSVGGPRLVGSANREVLTSIFKTPVDGPVMIRRHSLDGDRQSDLNVHGGEFKAVYAYRAEDYPWWRGALGHDLESANFGENLTVRGLSADAIHVGDVFRAGEAELEATEPRLPCHKLGIRFGDPQMVRRFAEARRWGVYFRVVTEGKVAAGDSLKRIHEDSAAIPISDVARVFLFDRSDAGTLERLATHERLDPSWREAFVERLEGSGARGKP